MITRRPAINTPHPPTHVDLEGMALRALSGAVAGRSGRKGKRDCRGCQKELHRGSGRQPMVACSCCWMLGAIRNMALVAFGLEVIRAEDAMRGLGLSQR